MPRVSTCGRASAVVGAGTEARGSGGGRGATFVFLAISCDIFHGGKTLDPLARSMFRVTWSGITIEMDQSLVCLYKV